MIVFAIVLYRVAVEDCLTLNSLQESLLGVPGAEHMILLLDNSPSCSSAPRDSENFVYKSFKQNFGLAKAYNYAISYARKIGGKYLVTLDQDSIITSQYISALILSLNRLQGNTVALCPRIRSYGKVVSPYVFTGLGLPNYGVTSGNLYSINSFTLYSVPYLESIGGFDEHYWLDGLDFSIFARIQCSGSRVLPLDVEVKHDLSLLSGAVQEWRMVNIMRYEACFLLEYCGWLHVMTGLARLLVRSLGLRRFGLKPRMFWPLLSATVAGAWVGIRRRYVGQRLRVQGVIK